MPYLIYRQTSFDCAAIYPFEIRRLVCQRADCHIGCLVETSRRTSPPSTYRSTNTNCINPFHLLFSFRFPFPMPMSDISSSADEEQGQVDALVQKIQQQPLDYDAHVQLISLLRSGPSADLDALATARGQFSALFPLTESLWQDWIADTSRFASTLQDAQVRLLHCSRILIALGIGSARLEEACSHSGLPVRPSLPKLLHRCHPSLHIPSSPGIQPARG